MTHDPRFYFRDCGKLLSISVKICKFVPKTPQKISRPHIPLKCMYYCAVPKERTDI
jgi:hypothetical protein